MGIGSLAKLGISKGMSLGRELFGFLLRSDLNVAKIAEGAGITMDTLKLDAPRGSERHSGEGCAFWGHRSTRSQQHQHTARQGRAGGCARYLLRLSCVP
jgi:hypothetical protein